MNKPMIIMIILLLLTLGGGATAFILMNDSEPKDPNNIDLIVERSLETEKITTSLQDGTFAQVSFKIQTDSTETKEELEKRMYQVKNIIINYFSRHAIEDLDGDNSIPELEKTIKSKINEILEHGEIEKVYTTSYVLQ